MVRALGWVSAGQFSSSSWFVQSMTPVAGSPPFLMRDAGLSGAGSNEFGFTYLGRAGKDIVVECSEDLIHWRAAATNRCSYEPLRFSEPASAPGQKLYRVRIAD